MTEQEQSDTLRLVTAVISRCGRMVPKFAPGTAQHTLLKNRIPALNISEALLGGRSVAEYSDKALTAAMEPLASIFRKCVKARSKYPPDSGQYSRYGGTIRAMELSRALIQNELDRRGL